MNIEQVIRNLEQFGEPAESRTDVDTNALTARYPELAAVSVQDVDVAGPHGPVPARLYRPDERPTAGLVWAHGGAFIGGHLDMPEANWVGLELASRGILVLSVDYRKALNGVKYPVPSDDVLAGWLWAVEHMGSIGVGAENLHLGGASAGAALSAGITMRLRDGAGPMPSTLLLAYPIVHPQLPPMSEELTRKIMSNPDARNLASEDVHDLNINFVGTAEAFDDPYAFAGVGDPAGLPPVFVLNSECDSLRASGEKYGGQLDSAGVPVRVETEPGTAHGHLDLPHSPEARKSIDRLVHWIEEYRRPLAQPPISRHALRSGLPSNSIENVQSC